MNSALDEDNELWFALFFLYNFPRMKENISNGKLTFGGLYL